MSYTAVTKGSDANPAQTLVSDLNTILLAAGYTNESDSPWTSGAKYARIWKSAAANNSSGIDFFICAYYDSATAVLVNLSVFETWDSANHKRRKYVPGASLNNAIPNASDNYCITDATGYLPDVGVTYVYTVDVNGSLTGYQYWISCTIDRLIIASRVSTDSCVYLGLVDNRLNTTDFPAAADRLWQGYVGGVLSSRLAGGPSSEAGGYTREVGQTAASWLNWGGWPGYDATSFIYPVGCGLESYDWFYKSGWYANPAIIYSGLGSCAVPVATMKDVYFCNRAAASNNGDTLTIDSKACVKMSYTSSKLWVDSTV